MKDIKYFIDYELNPDDARVAEHETMFSFDNDPGNYAFNEWWGIVGERSFKKYCQDNIKRLNEDYG